MNTKMSYKTKDMLVSVKAIQSFIQVSCCIKFQMSNLMKQLRNIRKNSKEKITYDANANNQLSQNLYKTRLKKPILESQT